MCCEHLICANCAGPVAEGRCSVCRSQRARMHHEGSGLSFPAMAAVLLTLLVAVAFLTTTMH
jgi:hypothetical protein